MKKPLILVAEDDIDDRFLLQSAFLEGGEKEEVVFVQNGIEVLAFLEQNLSSLPSLIMLDLNMPKKDGKEVLSEIKSTTVLKNIPVIIYTTTRSVAEVKRCYELGANTYIVKPVTFDSLCGVVESIRSYWFDTATISHDTTRAASVY